jgi:hypothetical protein
MFQSSVSNPSLKATMLKVNEHLCQFYAIEVNTCGVKEKATTLKENIEAGIFCPFIRHTKSHFPTLIPSKVIPGK